VHTAIDGHSRLAYSELLADERKDTAAAFWLRANNSFAQQGINHCAKSVDRQRRMLSLHSLRPSPRRHRASPHPALTGRGRSGESHGLPLPGLAPAGRATSVYAPLGIVVGELTA
jgi:hypothetical protein